jgi:hypothetical protein
VIESWPAGATLSGMEAALDHGIVHWDRVPHGVALDPDAFLGERTDLPQAARPGEWCTLVLVDALGEAKWTLVAVEPGRQTHPREQQLQPTVPRRRAAASAGRRGAPLGDALARVPQPAASVSPSGSGTDGKQAESLVAGESGGDESATGSSVRGR